MCYINVKMEKRKIRSKRRYFLAFLIGTFIFILGFGLTYSLSYLEYQRISKLQIQTSYEIFQDKLSYSFLNEDICNFSSFKKISEDLGFQGRIIDDLERKFGKNDEKVLLRKNFYTLVELEHFEFVESINEKCNKEIPTILFFYSNEKKDAESSEGLGELLSVIYRRNSELIIYSFDINLDNYLILALKEKYGIDGPLTLIINGRIKVMNPENIKEIEKYLGYHEFVIRL